MLSCTSFLSFTYYVLGVRAVFSLRALIRTWLNPIRTYVMNIKLLAVSIAAAACGTNAFAAEIYNSEGSTLSLGG